MELKNKRLAALWSTSKYDSQKTKKNKPIDGDFIFNSLFSVGAFASRKETSIQKKFARTTSDRLLSKLKKHRDDVAASAEEIRKKMAMLEINANHSTNTYPIDIDNKRFTPETIMLMKIFIETDAYFFELYKASRNGELTNDEHHQLRSEKVRSLMTLLNEVNKACVSFHKARKEIGDTK